MPKDPFYFPNQDSKTGTAAAFRWQRWDVTLENFETAANRFDITERHDLLIESGRVKRIYRTISLAQLTAIENIQVSEDGTPLRFSRDGEPGTFSHYTEGGYCWITYYFLHPADANEQCHATISYTVRGALRSSPAGDSLRWYALPTQHALPIDDSTVTVRMPPELPLHEITGVPDNRWVKSIVDNTITWAALAVSSSQKTIDIRVQYPHNPQMVAPTWQLKAGRSRSNAASLTPQKRRKRRIVMAVFIACVVGVVAISMLFLQSIQGQRSYSSYGGASSGASGVLIVAPVGSAGSSYQSDSSSSSSSSDSGGGDSGGGGDAGGD